MWEKSKGTTKCEKRTVIYDIGTAQYEDGTVKCEKKSKGTTKYEKRGVTCDLRTTQCEDGTIKYEKKIKGTTQCDKRTVICNVGIAQCKDETVKYEKKKVTEPPNVRKELSHVMLELHNVRMKPSSMRKK